MGVVRVLAKSSRGRSRVAAIVGDGRPLADMHAVILELHEQHKVELPGAGDELWDSAYLEVTTHTRVTPDGRLVMAAPPPRWARPGVMLVLSVGYMLLVPALVIALLVVAL
jgi:hypothetical protein